MTSHRVQADDERVTEEEEAQITESEEDFAGGHFLTLDEFNRDMA